MASIPPFLIARRAIEAEAGRLGLAHRAFIGGEALEAWVAGIAPEKRLRYGLDDLGAVMVAALAFDEGPAGPPDSPAAPRLARLGRFARANWYGEILARLKAAAVAARAALVAAGYDPGPARLWRQLANSALPERPLALAAGLGRLGRSGLLLVPKDGPGVVLGLLLLPGRLGGFLAGEAPAFETRARRSPDETCGSCRACVDACPTGALSADGSFERERCIQHWTSRAGGLPGIVEEHWGERLYGCDSCTEACPRFSDRSTIVPTLGLLGPGLPAAEIAAASDSELRSRFKGSVLGQAWIEPEALRRNARLCLASQGPAI
jgi:epoxyqueuosine reductase